MSMEALQAQEDLMKSIESFLKKFNRISFGKTPKVLLQAWDNFFEVKHAQSEEIEITDERARSIHSIPPGIDSFDAESDLVESVLNQDISIDSSPKIDSLSNEFAGELILPKSISPEMRKLNLTRKDCPDCEDSQFCHSSRVSHPQLHLGNPIS
ncbi:hypothetical protein Tco_1449675 [Tanacetum coccineum]